jgi:hypothetical protein
MNWIQFGLGAIAAAALSWLLHTVDVNRLEKIHAGELKAQATRLESICTADQKLTKGKNDELRKDRDAIARRLADYKRLHPASPVIPAPSREAIVGKAREGYAGGYGAVAGSTDEFRDYGAECELIRRDFRSCDSFVDDAWRSRGQ